MLFELALRAIWSNRALTVPILLFAGVSSLSGLFSLMALIGLAAYLSATGILRKLVDALIGRESFDRARESLNEERRELEGTGARRGRIEEARERLRELEERLEEYGRKRERLREIESRMRVLEGPPDLPGSIREAELAEERLRRDLDALRMYDEYLRRREELSLRRDSLLRELSLIHI